MHLRKPQIHRYRFILHLHLLQSQNSGLTKGEVYPKPMESQTHGVLQVAAGHEAWGR